MEPVKTLFETALTEISSTDVEGLGSIRFDRYGNVYKWVYNASGGALTAGTPVSYSDGVAVANRRKHIVTPSAGDEEMVAGVVMAASLTSVYYGWIKCQGLMAEVNVNRDTSVAIAIGDTLKLASAATSLVYGAAGGNVPNSYPFVAEEAYASASTSATALKAVRLNCPL